MQEDWASENLQVIRTLMERGAVYRRALAPVMCAVGITGLAAGGVAAMAKIQTTAAFAVYWMVVAVLCLAEALLLARRQALKDQEPFWSPPTRRVAQALLPAYFCGVAAGVIMAGAGGVEEWMLPPVWMAMYGCALHAAGFFMPRGFKLFGWGFIVAACFWAWAAPHSLSAAHWAMGANFGGAHAAYGVYLYFTEKRGNAT
jgi:hypothetical protein